MCVSALTQYSIGGAPQYNSLVVESMAEELSASEIQLLLSYVTSQLYSELELNKKNKQTHEALV